MAVAAAEDGTPVEVIVVVVDKSTIGAFEEGATPIGTGDRNPIVGDDLSDPLVLHVRSDCEWTLRLKVQPHD